MKGLRGIKDSVMKSKVIASIIKKKLEEIPFLASSVMKGLWKLTK